MMAACISYQLQQRVPPVPATNQPVATDYIGCCPECCLHRTKRTVVVDTERNVPAVWGAVRVTTRGHAMEKERSNRKNHHMNINDRHHTPDCLTQKVQHSYDTTPLIIAGGHFP